MRAATRGILRWIMPWWEARARVVAEQALSAEFDVETALSAEFDVETALSAEFDVDLALEAEF